MLIPADEYEGRPTYHILIDNRVIEYSYKEEFKNLIITGEFKYDEDLVFEAQGD